MKDTGNSSERLLQLLKEHFGFTAFRHNQQAIIETILSGKDSMVLMPTGGGKSVCYQIPALALEGLTVVVSPLIALMKDQVDALHQNGIEAAYLNSTLSNYEQQDILDRLPLKNKPALKSQLKLLYISPERLLGERNFLNHLKEKVQVALFAIDEAHCISDWGHDFRPEYLMLGNLKQQFPETPIIALTATADTNTRNDIIKKLQLTHYATFENSFNRPNISYTIKPRKNHFDHLCQYLKERRNEAGIIYCLSRNSTETLAEKLREQGFDAIAYHAGLEKQVREERQDLFLKDEVKIIVATIAFGMGINKSNVRYVIHIDMPKNLEGYYQETGRAGRDGLASEALLYYTGADVIKLTNMVQVEGNEEQSRLMLKKLKQMAEFCELHTCRRKYLLNYFSEYTGNYCGNCDVCLSDQVKSDMTIAGQKILSAVSRLEERFGLNYVIDFLRGSDAIKGMHRGLKTYGAGKEYSKDQWRSFMKEMIQLGYLKQTDGQYPILQLTEESKPVLKGEAVLMLTVLTKAPETKTKPVATKGVAASMPAIEQDLFDALKALRKQIATSENVPPYIIFSDATLSELASYLPITLSDISKINGFGEVKMAKYGEPFLEMVQDYCINHQLYTRIQHKQDKRKR
ncbi:ATP-dependent DNA helicase RecQ [Filimonas lacunae]|uniref:DNA helicase RecQ n=1 Tax=Filimonas lacunae TaxID=477680 RepID=A0A173MR52_9BACT|nr:DNA helicase RecQ [Filimonas lacunae]BAV09967.1 ATP-dependent DNA helicase RecQ [Filimonas lacunae]SIS81838.1 ATP-dependent DNA helicase RecQ [Filimonas lacunae]